MKTIKRLSLSEQVVRSIVQYVQENNLQPGDQLPTENEFAESKRSDDNAPASSAPASMPEGNGFMNIPDGIDEELPFN